MLSLVVLLSLAAAQVHAATTYTVSLQTDAASYSGSQPIVISGTVSPAPGANTGIIISITNSQGALADIDEVIPGQSTGAFSFTSHPGGNSAWISGTFSVNATWGGDGETASSVVTFTYSATATTSTTSSSTTTSTTSRTSTSSTSSAVSSTTSTTTTTTSSSQSTSTSTSSKSTSTITSTTPEFPASALALVALAVVAAVALLSRRLPSRATAQLSGEKS